MDHWQDVSSEPTSIPYTVEGRCGSVKVKLIPAPRGTGLCIEKRVCKNPKTCRDQGCVVSDTRKNGHKIKFNLCVF